MAWRRERDREKQRKRDNVKQKMFKLKFIQLLAFCLVCSNTQPFYLSPHALLINVFNFL